MENVPVATTNLAAEKAAALLKLFPECTGERGEVDFEKLKQTLADHVIEGDVERYQFTWPGKRAAMAEANVPTTKTLAPCEEESVDFAKTQNLYIEGDNLEVLKILRASYLGQVKMIYIDPPYNTGHDFVYHDRFAISQEEADQRGGNVDDLGRRFIENSESNPRYHSDWCSMMYPRLKLARDLMRDDGVIFMSIGDDEVVQSVKIFDEIFGAENRINLVVRIAKRTSDKGTHFRPTKDYLVCYAKNKDYVSEFGVPKERDVSEYPYIDETGRHYKKSGASLFQPSLDSRPNQRYYIEAPDGSLIIPPGTVFPSQMSDGAKVTPQSNADKVWRWSVDSYLRQKDRLIFTKGSDRNPLLNEHGERSNWNIYPKVYFDEDIEATLHPEDVVYDFTNSQATKELLSLGVPFDFSKPSTLIKYLIEILRSKSDSLILDFFSGSATTAHAVMQLNAEDGGHRKFILVQLPEVCAEGSEAAKAGYKNICEIGKERIRRAGKKIVEELESKTKSGESKSKCGEVDLFAAVGGNGGRGATALPDGGHGVTALPDVGFRVLKVVDSPMVDASKPAGETTQAELSFSSVKTGVKNAALLFHTMLRLGIAPTDTIEYKTIEGNKVACVGGVQLVAALDANTDMTNAFIEAIAKMNPGVAVFRDDTFRNNNALRISLEQTFKQLSKETKIEVM